jgi:hypothetical protein
VLVRVASRRATDAELGDVVEEYVAAGRSASWFVSQVVSIVRRRRSPLTISERGAEMLSNVRNDIRYALRTTQPGICGRRNRTDGVRYRHQYGSLFNPQQRRMAVTAGTGP